ncbi:CAP domain-containing protein [Phycomyces nitens]|nr:CAP domain-containing protein [Phycomyces nitens]
MHNAFRRQHSAPPLIWDNELAKFAQKWSSKCQFGHSDGPYGENIAGGAENWREAFDLWANEERNYNRNQPGYRFDTGHYTQIVWKSTQRLGCGKSFCPSLGFFFFVCSYSPPGNTISGPNGATQRSLFLENVH